MGTSYNNPFTAMRANIENVLEQSEEVVDLSVRVRKWDGSYLQHVDNPAADRSKWVRVETTSIEYDPYWSNGLTRATHRLRLVCALPVQAGLKQEDIEDFAYVIMQAMTPLSRDLHLLHEVKSLERVVYRAGAIGLSDTDQPDREATIGDMVWSQVGEFEVTYHFALSDMTTEILP